MNEVNNQRLIDWSINLLLRVIGRGRRNIIRAENAIIENISRDNRTVYVTISYGILGDFNVINMEWSGW